jgi:AP endonuclease-1
MCGKKSRKIHSKVLEAEATEGVVTPLSTAKKVRKALKIESVEVVTEVEKSTPARNRKKVKAEVDSDDEDIVPSTKSPAKIKIYKIKTEAVLEEEQAPKAKKAPAKRKAKTEGDGDEKAAEEHKVKKKRKTKEEKEAEAMPLAERTVIGTLKKAMHIGAHVSGAGGMSLDAV